MKSAYIKNTLLLTVSQYIAQIFNVLRSFIIANLLGPYDFGLWNKILFYINYATYLNFGTDIFINREINQNIKKNNYRINNIFYYYLKFFKNNLLILSLFLFISVFFHNLYLKATSDNFTNYTLLFIYFSIIATLIYRVINFILLGIGSFLLVGIYRIINAFVSLALSYILCKYLGIYGMYLSFIFALVLPVCFILLFYNKHIFKLINFKKFKIIKFNKKVFKSFILNSSTLVTLNFLIMFWIQFDRFFITFLYKSKEVGFYFFSANISQGLITISISIATVYYQKINKYIAEGKDLLFVLESLKKIFKYFIFYYPLILITIYYISPVIVGSFFKKYTFSIEILNLLLPSNLILVLILILSYFFMAIKKQNIFIKYLLYSFVIATPLYFLAYYFFNIRIFPVVLFFTNLVLLVFLYKKALSLSSLNKNTNFFIILISLTKSLLIILISIYLNNLLFYNVSNIYLNAFIKTASSFFLYFLFFYLLKYFLLFSLKVNITK